MTDHPSDPGALSASDSSVVAPAGLDVGEAVAPRSTREASRILADAGRSQRTVGFAGSGSSLGLGGMGRYDLGLVSTGMPDIIDWQPEDLTIVVGSGVTIGDLESELAAHRQTSLLPRDNPDRTVGGVIAEGASSYSRLKYGPTRDRLLEVTLATGYGERVRGGARVVKNVTGYDLPRLVTGSMGSLGFIGTVCLKLWPLPPYRQVARVEDAAMAFASAFRPVAVLETDEGSFAKLEGSAGDVAAQAAVIGGEISGEVSIPRPIDMPVMASVRVPPRLLSPGIDAVRGAGATRWIAQHGIGIIEAGWPELDAGTFGELRRSIEHLSGATVVRRSGDDLDDVDPWGASPDAIVIQRRLKGLFDPASVCNPGKLPGGL